MGCASSKDVPAASHAQAYGNMMNFEETAPEPSGPDLRPDTPFMWYWEEDSERLKNHHTWDKQGNYVAYPPKVSCYLEERHAAGGNADRLEITYKAFHAHTGYSYRVDFRTMRQINTGTGYERPIMRRANPNYAPPVLTAQVVHATAVAVEAPRNESAGGRPEPPSELFTSYLKTISLEHFTQLCTGTNLNHEAKGGGTLLTWAAEMHRPDLCGFLLDNGAHLELKDWTSGNDALQWAESTMAIGDERPPVDRAATIALLKGRAQKYRGYSSGQGSENLLSIK